MKVMWYVRGVQNVFRGFPPAAMGAAAMGLGYYVLHQHIRRGTGENLSSVQDISYSLGRPRVVVKEESISIWDGTETKAKKDWNRTMDRAMTMTYWEGGTGQMGEKAREVGKEVYTQAKQVDDEHKVVATIASIPTQVQEKVKQLT